MVDLCCFPLVVKDPYVTNHCLEKAPSISVCFQLSIFLPTMRSQGPFGRTGSGGGGK